MAKATKLNGQILSVGSLRISGDEHTFTETYEHPETPDVKVVLVKVSSFEQHLRIQEEVHGSHGSTPGRGMSCTDIHHNGINAKQIANLL